MKNQFFRPLLLLALLAFAAPCCAQLPNEKFGKPSAMEWDFVGWGEAANADAIVLCKTMKVTYRLSDQVFNASQSNDELGYDNLQDFGKNDIDNSNIVVKYEFRLRTKILKAAGGHHANVDITYFNADNERLISRDDVTDLKVRVFTRNAKGKVEKRTVDARTFSTERVDDNYVVLHVVVPGVEAGSIVEYQYDITSTRPTFLYDWTFQECIPTLHSKCDIEIPAILQFNMNVPINRLIQSGVEEGRLSYDTNRPDMKKGKTCPTNHYKVSGDYILPGGEEIAPLTSRIVSPGATPPAYIPQGMTHLKIK